MARGRTPRTLLSLVNIESVSISITSSVKRKPTSSNVQRRFPRFVRAYESMSRRKYVRNYTNVRCEFVAENVKRRFQAEKSPVGPTARPILSRDSRASFPLEKYLFDHDGEQISPQISRRTCSAQPRCALCLVYARLHVRVRSFWDSPVTRSLNPLEAASERGLGCPTAKRGKTESAFASRAFCERICSEKCTRA